MNTERPENPGDADLPRPSGEPAATPSGASASDDSDPRSPAEVPDVSTRPESAEGTSRRRPASLVVTVAAAAVLLAGGGGAYLAASGDGAGRTGTAAASGGGDTAPPPLALDGWSADGTRGVAPGEPAPYGARYVAQGHLPGGPRSAPVYGPGAEVGRDRVVRLAKALGVEGTPVAEGRLWRIGGQDGSGPVLEVRRDAPGNWTFSRLAPGTDDCRKVTVCAHDPAAPAGAPVSVAAAEKAAAPVLRAAGLDGARTDASQVMGDQRVVEADPVVGGLPTYGWTTGLTVGRRGEVVGGQGLLATPVKGDTYPVLGARRTLELLNGPAADGHRMGIGGCASPVPLKDRLEQPCGAAAGASASAAPRDTLTVRKAVFGLAAHSVGGRRALVPSWLFQVRGSTAGDAFTVTYPAVDPAHLAAASPSPVTAEPSSAPASATPGRSREVRVSAYTADGRTLNLSFSGGVCADYRTSARESGGRVTVRVTETPWPGRVCVLIAREYVKTVRLGAPLDGRSVVGTDGREVARAVAGSLRPDAAARPR
ncbi:hypothetical protein ACIQVT_07895 [Streptomyces sp. NPDC100445]|uniref:hypothetical protein n=1 Tax=Streptomyces sp. NPDC100445 TaxID=3366102 RepID=UPI0038147EFC